MNDQLKLWTGDFGDVYHLRNPNSFKSVKARVAMFKDILSVIEQNDNKKNPKRILRSVLEVGAGTGANLLAIRESSSAILAAVEPNRSAFDEIKATGVATGLMMCCDWMDFPDSYEKWDMVFTSGVLIHVHPTRRKKFMDKVIEVSDRYVVAIEYFSPELREVTYHGESDALWIDDWGKLYADMGLKLLSCKFYYKGLTWLDNLTCFIFEKV